jgi:hypothetical protein
LDARDSQGNWYKSEIVDVDSKAQKVKVHFHEWAPKWDEWLSVTSICNCRGQCGCDARMAALGSQTRFTIKGVCSSPL